MSISEDRAEQMRVASDFERKRRREQALMTPIPITGQPHKRAYRTVTTENGTAVPFERIVIDPRALTMAADLYESETGQVDEIVLGQAVLLYMEAEAS
jgi:hypothetical protein